MSNGPSHFQELVGIVERLRSPGGCPWDREQTHGSLKRHLLEEAYEVMEAIDDGNPSRLREELGDILVQVVFHAQMAREAQDFDVDDVVSRVSDKLVRRHPHVFADAAASDARPPDARPPDARPSDARPPDAREVELNWERLKDAERGHRSPVDGIPGALPALSHAQLMQDRVSKAGFEWDDVSGVLDKVAEEAGELVDARNDEERAREFGDLLFVMVNLARWLNIQAEDALRQANDRFRGRYVTMERLASDRGLDFHSIPMSAKEGLWQEAKGITGPGP